MRVFKFSTVGLSGLFVNEFLLFFFTEFLGIFYLVSSIFASVVSTTINFIINDNWTFRERRKGNLIKRLLKYYSISFVTVVIIVTVLFVLTNFLGIHYLISNIIGIFIAFSWSLLANQRWTWRDENKSSSGIEREPGLFGLMRFIIRLYWRKLNK